MEDIKTARELWDYGEKVYNDIQNAKVTFPSEMHDTIQGELRKMVEEYKAWKEKNQETP